jgi:hypothetical protein
MPYISQGDRSGYDTVLRELEDYFEGGKWNPGHVNYVFCKILDMWFESKRRYQTICEIEGTLACVAKEFYRRKAVPYEEEQKIMNGDVFNG